MFRRCRVCWELLEGKPVTCQKCHEAYALFQEGAQLQFRQHDVAAAFQVYDHALALEPLFPDVLVNVGLIHCMNGEAERGITHLSAALRLAPYDAEALLNRARAYFTLKKIAEAIADIDKVLEYHPATLEDKIAGDDFVAQDMLAACVESHAKPMDYYGFYIRGITNQLNGNFKAASEDFYESLRHKRDNAFVLARLALLNWKERNYHDADFTKVMFEKAIKTDPECWLAHALKGFFFYVCVPSKETLPIAQNCFITAVKLAPRGWTEVPSLEQYQENIERKLDPEIIN